jgi:hypothetical protein
LAGPLGGRAFADDSAARIVKRYARRVGLNAAAYSGHSLRSGFLTSAAESGASIFKMMDVSRHRSMDTLRGYVRKADMFQRARRGGVPVMGSPWHEPKRRRITQIKVLQTMRSAFALVLVASLASSNASANTFRNEDSGPYLELAKRAHAMRKDVNEALSMVGHKGDFNQVDCLNEIWVSLTSLFNQLSSASDLIQISARMQNAADESVVNAILATNSASAVQEAAEDRRHALAQAALCSGSALVNTYAQKAAALHDEADTLFRATSAKARRKRSSVFAPRRN